MVVPPGKLSRGNGGLTRNTLAWSDIGATAAPMALVMGPTIAATPSSMSSCTTRLVTTGLFVVLDDELHPAPGYATALIALLDGQLDGIAPSDTQVSCPTRSTAHEPDENGSGGEQADRPDQKMDAGHHSQTC